MFGMFIVSHSSGGNFHSCLRETVTHVMLSVADRRSKLVQNLNSLMRLRKLTSKQRSHSDTYNIQTQPCTLPRLTLFFTDAFRYSGLRQLLDRTHTNTPSYIVAVSHAVDGISELPLCLLLYLFTVRSHRGELHHALRQNNGFNQITFKKRDFSHTL